MDNALSGGITRRAFVGGLIGSGCLAFAGCAGNSGNIKVESYYVRNSDRILQEYDYLLNTLKATLMEQFRPEVCEDVWMQTKADFNRVLRKLPDIGGESNMALSYLYDAALTEAFFYNITPLSLSQEQAGRVLYDSRRHMFDNREAFGEDAKKGAAMFTAQGMSSIESWTKWTQKRQYQENFVAEFITGDGKTYDFGVDIVECANLKYLKSQELGGITRFVCPNGFLYSKAMGTGLSRTKTLAYGFDRCNFRFKKGREVVQDWNSEMELIASQVKAGLLADR